MVSVGHRKIGTFVLICLLTIVSVINQGAEEGTKDDRPASDDQILPDCWLSAEELDSLLSNMEGHFTENRGQFGEDRVRFVAQGYPLSVALTTEGVIFRMSDDKQEIDLDAHNGGAEGPASLDFFLRFLGINEVEPTGSDPLGVPMNFFMGNDEDAWVRGARTFREVRYDGLYDGVDLRFYFKEGWFKYDFILESREHASRIQMRYEGVLGLETDGNSGDLIIRTARGDIRDCAPLVFECGPEGLPGIRGHYVVHDGVFISYDLPEGISEDVPVIIDPGLEYCTYFGGNGADTFAQIPDMDGNIYIFGTTTS
ncbi:MAG: hypothetical protein KAQ96_07590, partial [Thermoplasmata archaeon]|nr:hypothetical protein [Thermoplasmata archaeon]